MTHFYKILLFLFKEFTKVNWKIMTVGYLNITII